MIAALLGSVIGVEREKKAWAPGLRTHSLAVGGGLYVEAVAATLVIVIILAGIKPLEDHFQQRHIQHEILVETRPGARR